MVPDGWEVKKLQEIAPVIDCKHRTPKYSETGIPIVSPGNIDWGKLELNGCRTISEVEFQTMMDHCVPNLGDLVFGRNQKVGFAGRVSTNDLFALGQDTVLIKPEKTSGHFLQYALQSQPIKKQIYKLLGGSTFGRINLKDLRDLQIPHPIKDERESITKILLTWDQAIETTEKLIENSERQKKALMQQLLTGKKRLKGFSGDWKACSIGELFEILTAPSKTKFIEEDGDKLIVDMGAIDRASKLVAHKTVKQRKHPLMRGDLVMPKDDIGGGQIIGRVVYIPNDSDYELGDHVYALRARGEVIDLKFAYYRVNEFSIRKSLRRKANGTAQLGLGKKDVMKKEITFPSLMEQKRIADIIKNIDATHFSLTRP